ncbi:MAG: diacylglycerol kinase family protein [Oscillatoriales cyanobacterium SM2_1_8]|nr:diacylglycerol kinase family protein [Oscillatoriales cyanobacterium SM2_1_8]
MKPDLPMETRTLRQRSFQVASSVLDSFRFAWQGICYAFWTQRNFRLELGVAVLAIALGWGLGLSPVAVAVVWLTCALVLALELLNTALESVVDLTLGKTYHRLAKIAKDCAAGAVSVAAIASLGIAGLLFGPPLWLRLAVATAGPT